MYMVYSVKCKQSHVWQGRGLQTTTTYIMTIVGRRNISWGSVYSWARNLIVATVMIYISSSCISCPNRKNLPTHNTG
uniref:Uncharacterized protein n=1 Tax=Lotus japonicus TaxID=34305 RepID=I3S4L4_LOTJA|nr:unknown [Lotus japonicus]